MFKFQKIMYMACLLQLSWAAILYTPGDAQFKMAYQPSDGRVKFVAKVKKNQYFAVGMGKQSMFDCDMVIFQADGSNGKVTDLWSTGYSKPGEDESQDYQDVTVIDEGNKLEITAYRALDTGDDNDYLLTTDQTFQLMWAEQVSTSELVKHNTKGYLVVSLPADGSDAVVIDSSITVTSSPDAAILHGVVMTIAWGILSFVMISTHRWHKHHIQNTALIHAITGTLMTLLTLYSGITQISKVGGISSMPIHYLLGSIMTICVTFIAIAGYLVLFIRRYVKWGTSMIIATKYIHKNGGLAMLLISVPTMSLGIYQLCENYYPDNNLWVLAPTMFFVWVIIISLFEGIYRLETSDLQTLNVVPDKKPVMTLEQFEQKIKNGQELWILDDLIIDASKFKFDHPGGKFLFDQTVGRDIGKFFYGTYALDDNTEGTVNKNRHFHSNLARNKAQKLAVATLFQTGGFGEYYKLTPDDKQIMKINSSTSALVFTKFYKFNDETDGKIYNPGIQTYYSGFKELGQHYLLQAVGLNASNEDDIHLKTKPRYYTICNAMRKKFYQQLVYVVNAATQPEDGDVFVGIDQSYLSTADSELITLSIKCYNPANGLSNRFYDPSLKDDVYKIKGPMGKGLGVTEQSQGQYIAFACGTGLLVFIDLITKLLLGNLQVIPQCDRVHQNFKLDLHVSFPGEEDGIALPLLRGLDAFCKKKNLTNFSLTVRLSEDQTERWDKNYAADVIKGKQAQKIWVCGPPIVAQNFEKYLSDIAKEQNFDFKSICDIM